MIKMKTPAYYEMEALAVQPEALESTVRYLADKMSAFVRRGEHVLICFPDTPNTIGDLFAKAVKRCEAFPEFCGEDIRWKTLLRQAFIGMYETVVAHPLVILGLAKLARRTNVPLVLRNVLMAGHPTSEWMVKGIQSGLDCKFWGCFDPGTEGIVAGFTCADGEVHLRDDIYGVEIVDKNGTPVAPGEIGEVILYPKTAPHIRVRTGYSARLDTKPCTCGCTSPRLVDLGQGMHVDQELSKLAQELHSWSSILDCRLEKGPHGLEMEVVVFQGEKLPKLPSAAKLVVRPWNPEKDVPIALVFDWRNQSFSEKSH